MFAFTPRHTHARSTTVDDTIVQIPSVADADKPQMSLHNESCMQKLNALHSALYEFIVCTKSVIAGGPSLNPVVDGTCQCLSIIHLLQTRNKVAILHDPISCLIVAAIFPKVVRTNHHGDLPYHHAVCTFVALALAEHHWPRRSLEQSFVLMHQFPISFIKYYG